MRIEYVRSDVDNFDEVVRRVKDIRATESRSYREVKDIFALCSYDYDKNSSNAKFFFSTFQDKLHYAITGCIASEIKLKRANANKENMGLTSWKNAPNGNILMSDVTVAKNYYLPDEITHLNDIVNMYLSFAQRQAELHKYMSMDDWNKKLDDFLKFHDYGILGKERKTLGQLANQFTRKEFVKYRNKDKCDI